MIMMTMKRTNLLVAAYINLALQHWHSDEQVDDGGDDDDDNNDVEQFIVYQ